MQEEHQWNIGEQGDALKRRDEKAVLIAVQDSKTNDELADEYLNELEFLAHTAGAYAQKRFIQKRDHPHHRTYVGEGKLEEIVDYTKDFDIDLALFDDDLSPRQQQILEEALKIKVLDRSSLILDIFASRAQTAQAKTQVELAQLQYLMPRLRGLWTHLERQRGGIGMRGPGEKEIETDRRIIRQKISQLKSKLEKIDQQNTTRRKQRGAMIRVALVGYTNVGKSTIMNALSKSEVFAENKLFATLDTTVRKVTLERMPFLLSDTVGFIRKLPHHLIESFKSTLDETLESDLLLHVVDVSHPHFEDQIATVQKTLHELGADEKPSIMIFNKMDAYRQRIFDDLLEEEVKEELEEGFVASMRAKYGENSLFISAINKEQFDHFRSVLYQRVSELYESRYPYMTKQF